MIVAVVVAMKALGHLINPSCPQPLFQSGVKRKAITWKYANFTGDFHLASFWKQEVSELGNGLLKIEAQLRWTLKLKPNQLVCRAVFG